MNIENLSLQIDSPTIFNNIDDNMLLNEFDGSVFLDDTKWKYFQMSRSTSYQHYSFHKIVPKNSILSINVSSRSSSDLQE